MLLECEADLVKVNLWSSSFPLWTEISLKKVYVSKAHMESSKAGAIVQVNPTKREGDGAVWGIPNGVEEDAKKGVANGEKCGLWH